MSGMYLFPISVYINSKDINYYQEIDAISIKTPSENVQLLPDLGLETVFPALKLPQIFCMNMNISLLGKWRLYHKLAPLLIRAHQASKIVLTT